MNNNPESNIALAFVTIERPHVAQRLILSARKKFPTLPIYVADQSAVTSTMEDFYQTMNIHLVRMEFDIGVCASRNRLTEIIKEEFFILCDDDFIFDEITDFNEAIKILNCYPEIGIIGGKLIDYDDNTEYVRHWELYLQYDKLNRTLTSIPISEYAPNVTELGSTRFYNCDAVMNFCVMRRSIFIHYDLKWDERFKSNGEHEDFYLNLKQNSPVRVAYLPTMVAYHHHPLTFSVYRTNLRDRLLGWEVFFDKWQIDQHLEIGYGVRTRTNYSEVVRSADARWRFFLNENLRVSRTSIQPAISIHKGKNLALLPSATSDGEPEKSAHTQSIILKKKNQKTVISPLISSNIDSKNINNSTSQEVATTRNRYQLEPIGKYEDPKTLGVSLSFFFNPILNIQSDFVLWSNAKKANSQSVSNDKAYISEIFLRWFSDEGEILIWQSAYYLVSLTESNYLKPILIELPIIPKNCSFVRFEIFIHKNNIDYHLATGFIYTPQNKEQFILNTLTSQVLPSMDFVENIGQTTYQKNIILKSIKQNNIENLTLSFHPNYPGLVCLKPQDLLKWSYLLLYPAHDINIQPILLPINTKYTTPLCIQQHIVYSLPISILDNIDFIGFNDKMGYQKIIFQNTINK